MSAPGLCTLLVSGSSSVKRGRRTGGFESSASRIKLSLLTGMEAWECGTSLSSGKSCGGTCGHFSDGNGEGRLFFSDSAFAPPLLQ